MNIESVTTVSVAARVAVSNFTIIGVLTRLLLRWLLKLCEIVCVQPRKGDVPLQRLRRVELPLAEQAHSPRQVDDRRACRPRARRRA